MVQHKLTAAQLRRIEEIKDFQQAVTKVKRWVAELDSNRAARQVVIDNITGAISRELTQLRQRALTSNVGTVGDSAGAMAVLAARGGGLNMKIRGLQEGLAGLQIQLDQALKMAMTPEKTTEGGGS